MKIIDLQRIQDHRMRGVGNLLPRQPAWDTPTDTVTVRADQIAGIFPGGGLVRSEKQDERKDDRGGTTWTMVPVAIPGWERGTWCDVAMLDGTRIYVRESFDSLRARWVAALNDCTKE